MKWDLVRKLVVDHIRIAIQNEYLSTYDLMPNLNRYYTYILF